MSQQNDKARESIVSEAVAISATTPCRR